MTRDIIVRALEERRVLELAYGGGAPLTVQPHAIVRKADGTELLEAYLVGGVVPEGSEHGWRNFELLRIDFVEPREERFEPRRDFRPVSGEFGRVMVQVKGDAAASR